MVEPDLEVEGVKIGSDRSFGLVFAIVFAIIGLWPAIQGGACHLWAIIVAVAFGSLAYMWPAVLRPLNIGWFRLGTALSAIVTPIVMAVLYVTTFVPTTLLLRAARRDLLRLKREPDRASYWLIRDPPGPGQGTMKRQF